MLCKKLFSIFSLFAVMFFGLSAVQERQACASPVIYAMVSEGDNLVIPSGEYRFLIMDITLGNYTVSSSDASIVNVWIDGTILCMGAVNSGTAAITVYSNGLPELAFMATVPAPPGISVNPESVTIERGQTAFCTISGGTGNYVAASQNTNIATAYVIGAGLGIEGVSAGTTAVMISDSASSMTGVIVTVTDNQPPPPASYTEWGAFNGLYCKDGTKLTFSLTLDGVTKKSVTYGSTSTPTFEGFVQTSPGVKNLTISLIGCSGVVNINGNMTTSIALESGKQYFISPGIEDDQLVIRIITQQSRMLSGQVEEPISTVIGRYKVDISCLQD